jgi:putative transposase
MFGEAGFVQRRVNPQLQGMGSPLRGLRRLRLRGGYTMRRSPYTELYLHLVWSTYDRLPLITPELQPRLYASIAHHCAELGAKVEAIGGICDHVPLLVRFPATISISEFVGKVKGGTSHFVTHVVQSREPFRWQGGYGAFTVSKRNLAAVRDYVLDQEARHSQGPDLPGRGASGEVKAPAG